MRWRIAAWALLWMTACGSRTGLLPGDDSQPSPPVSGSTAPLCAASLLAGAPTPMQGFCPTRANQGVAFAPSAPQIVWARPVLSPVISGELTVPEIVVDPAGRAYVTTSTSRRSTTSSGEIAAVDPDGTVAWRLAFATPVSSLTLASDGLLWAAGSPADAAVSPACGSCAGVLSAVTREGAVQTTAPVAGPLASSALPVLYQGLALGTDGSVFLQGLAGTPDSGSPGAPASTPTAGPLHARTT